MLKKSALFVLMLCLCSVFAFGDFVENLDSLNTSKFEVANGWTNGNPFNSTWRSDCVTFSNGIMTLKLDRDSGNPPYKSGEYRTKDFYSYGYFEVRMKATKKQGTLSSFFTYTGPSDNNPWDEIDIEILGKNTWQMQVNYYTNGTGGHESFINLGFDASLDFHNYGFEWRRDYIKWYVDGKLVHTENGSRGALPSTPSKIMMNHWPGIGVDDWLGPFDGQTPQYAYYDWFSYTQNGPGPVVTPTPVVTPRPVTPRPVTPQPHLKGDVDGNWIVNIVDALKTAQYSVGLIPQGFNVAAADVDNNGVVNIVDALKIAQYYVGLIPNL
jgi:beta-glucanase (GH16 family)